MATTGTSSLDGRERKTRAALHWALLTLLAEKPYCEITVEDITTAADVARTTFDAHYRDTTHLLNEAATDVLKTLEHQFTAVTWTDPPNYNATGLFTLLLHVGRHRELYRLLISGEGGAGPRAALVASLREATARSLGAGVGDDQEVRLPLQLITTAFVGALLATIEAWLDGAIDMDPSALAISLMRQQVDGLEWALGFQAGQMVFGTPPCSTEPDPAGPPEQRLRG